MTKVGSLVQSRGLWGIVIKDGEGFRRNQVRVLWCDEGEREWFYITDLVWSPFPPPSYKW
jgi:hypothetical protein